MCIGSKYSIATSCKLDEQINRINDYVKLKRQETVINTSPVVITGQSGYIKTSRYKRPPEIIIDCVYIDTMPNVPPAPRNKI